MRSCFFILLITPALAFADPKFAAEQEIKIAFENVSYGDPIVVKADMDKDGGADLLVSVDDGTLLTKKFVWVGYQNKTWNERTIFTGWKDEGDDITGMGAADFDGDGDPDIAAISKNDEVMVFENVSEGKAFTKRSVATNAGVYGYRHGIVQIADVDKDAKPDILIAARGVIWLRNMGGGAFAAPARLVESTRDCLYHFAVTDLDNDGDPDVVVHCNSALLKLTNTNGTFASSTIEMRESYITLLVADVTGDKLPDIVTSHNGTGVDLLENVAGQAFQKTVIIPETNIVDINRVDAGDHDLDGKTDILVTRRGAFVWVSGVTKQEKPIVEITGATQAEMTWSVALDVDRDGDLDVIGYKTLQGYGMRWVENLQKTPPDGGSNPDPDDPDDPGGDAEAGGCNALRGTGSLFAIMLALAAMGRRRASRRRA